MTKKLNKEKAAKILAEVPAEKKFYFCNGKAAKNLEEFAQLLAEANPDEFNYHRNAEKNDFYNWIMEVIRDKKLANEVARAKTKNTTIKRVNNRIGALKTISQDGKKKV